MTKKPVIALVGGVASGKSAVANALARRGALVVNADIEGHAVLREAEVRDEIVAEFGAGVLDKAGEIDRRKLGKQVFDDEKKLAILNAITHPRIRQRTNAKIDAGLNDPGVKVVVLDVSLLLESGAYEGKFDLLVFVDAREDTRVARARRRGWEKADLKARQSRQMSLAEKKKRAAVIIDNNGALEDLEHQIEKLWHDYVDPH